MTETLILALDAMGGDQAPDIVVEGAAIALLRHPGVRFRLHGDGGLLKPLVKAQRGLSDAAEIVHTDESVLMEDKPSEAVRRGRKTSMWLAIDDVRKGNAHVAVSAGNTGALMAMAKIQLKTMPNISRPAIAALWPTERGESVVLDLGANIATDGRQLVEFAILGEAYAIALGLPNPSVGLLNIGVEEVKGHDEIKAAAKVLRDSPLEMNYFGFVEGDDIAKGTVDVIVTDGFTGNIALKTAEGTARQFAHFLRLALKRSFWGRLGAFFAAGAFRALSAKMDPRSLNGGVFLGLNGLVVKSHGGTDGKGFASALDVAIDMAESDFKHSIEARLVELADLETNDPDSNVSQEVVAS